MLTRTPDSRGSVFVAGRPPGAAGAVARPPAPRPGPGRRRRAWWRLRAPVGRSLAGLLVVGWMFACGCGYAPKLEFNPVAPEDRFVIGGKLAIGSPVEADLMASVRPVLMTVTDFAKFQVSLANVSAWAAANGQFRLPAVAFASDHLLRAQNGKVVLLRRIYPTDLSSTDVSNLAVDLQTTARALIWQRGVALGKELTLADIDARGYENLVASVVTALKFALQMPPSSVPKTILELSMVTGPVDAAARAITAREATLREAHQVLFHALLREDLGLIANYLSPDFGNDWDPASNYAHFMTVTESRFKRYRVMACDTGIDQLEFLPGDVARMRAHAKITVQHQISGLLRTTVGFTADIWWRREGSLWKIYRNLPYQSNHPTEPDQDGRWGELQRAMESLRQAVLIENLDQLASGVSEAFGNDFDRTSTKANLLLTAQARFGRTDAELVEFAVEGVTFPAPDVARVMTRARVRVINILSFALVDTATIRYEVTWQREHDGAWRIRRNLPYQWHHPRQPPARQS